MSNKKAHQYAIDNGEEVGTMDYLTTMHDYQNGYNDGRAEGNQLKMAIELLRRTVNLAQNQKWNVLYPQSEKVRNEIEVFLSNK